jgi:hypothetical protein
MYLLDCVLSNENKTHFSRQSAAYVKNRGKICRFTLLPQVITIPRIYAFMKASSSSKHQICCMSWTLRNRRMVAVAVVPYVFK